MACTELTLTIPPWTSARRGARSRISWNGARRLVVITSSHTSSGVSATDRLGWKAALLTSPSRRSRVELVDQRGRRRRVAEVDGDQLGRPATSPTSSAPVGADDPPAVGAERGRRRPADAAERRR